MHKRNKTQAKPSSLSSRQAQEVSKIVQKNFSKRVELKYYTFGAQPTVTSGAPVITSLSDIAQGDTDITRNGDRLNMIRLELRYIMKVNLSNLIPANIVRVIIFQWLPNDGTAAPTVSNILTPDGFTGTFTVLSAHNHDGRDMYRIVYDHCHVIVGTGTIYSQASGICVDKVVSLAAAIKHVQFNGSTTNATNKLFVLFLTDATVNQPFVYWNTKLYFRDP
jgi:hypothetical protein